MSELSRRRFIGASAVFAAAFGLPLEIVGRALDVPALADTGAPTTLQQTIVLANANGYRKLRYGQAEQFLVRGDLGTGPKPGRETRRRSLLYFAQHSDSHVIESQSPARLEPSDVLYLFGAGAAYRPQEVLTVQVLDQLVRATNDTTASPVTGAPLAFCVMTGDMTDSNVRAELRWYIDTMDGKVVQPDTGNLGVYEGVEAWPESAAYAYHPDNPSGDVYGQRGFPQHKGMLEAAIAPFQTAGIHVPWLAVFGNHDVIWNGALPNAPIRQMLARSNHKAGDLGTLVAALLFSGAGEDAMQFLQQLWENGSGHPVTADPDRRRMLNPMEWMRELFVTEATPGPVGHGFTEDNIGSGVTWWAKDSGPFRLIGLDSCNHEAGDSGVVLEPEYGWLEQQLTAASKRYYDTSGNLVSNPNGADKLCVLFSHHNSWTTTNTNWEQGRPFRQYHGDEVVALLHRFPNAVMWVNGHSHENRIVPHANPHETGAGVWELNTASCIDAPQQGRLIDVVDNMDGTISVFTFSLDHSAPPDPGGGDGYTPSRLASISRELASNDPFTKGLTESPDPFAARGDVSDRNCELVVKAPFDLGTVGSTQLQLQSMQRRTRLLTRTVVAVGAGAGR